MSRLAHPGRAGHAGQLAPRLLAVLLALTLGCATRAALIRPVPPLRLGAQLAEGDAQRRASTRVTLDGLSHDARRDFAAAQGLYERALEVDPTNPWAYLALARLHCDGPQPQRALPFLDKAHALLSREPAPPPGAEAHLVGLRGQVLRALGREQDAAPLLARARALDPEAWADARLDAAELR